MFLRALVLLVLLGISNAQTTAEVDQPTTEQPPTDEPSTAAPVTDSQTSGAPVTMAPTTDTPETETPSTDPPSTAAPSTEAPSTEAPSTEAPSTEAPSTEAPSTGAPSTGAPSTESPTTTAPPSDGLSVSCTSDQMMVFLDHTKHPRLDLDEVTLKDTKCNLTDYGNMNRTHLWMTVPFDGCMTNHSTEDDTITYQNSIISETRASPVSSIISREFQAEFPFKCTFPRSALLSVVSFSPKQRVIYTKTAEFGNFTFTMDMYETNDYENVYDDFPVRLDLNDSMYLEVKVTANDSKLVLIPLKCWGTPTDDEGDNKYYVFIDDGCKNKDDPTLVYDYQENSVQRFQLGAFRFMKESANAQVYLHCNVEACRKGDSESRCAKGCDEGLMRRGRRSLVLDAVSEQTVSIGPIDLQETYSEHVEEQSSVGSLTVIAAVAGVLGVVVLALVVALVMLYKRYNSPQIAARVVYTKASSEDGKLLV